MWQLIIVSFLIVTNFCLPTKQQDQQDGNCECVKYYLCEDPSYFNDDGQLTIDLRNDNACGNYLLRCCKPQYIVKSEEKVEIRLLDATNQCRKPITDGLSGDDFPSIVRILKKEQIFNEKKRHCIGTLIHPRAVLTVAHCIQRLGSATQLKIRAGNMQTSDKQISYQYREVQDIISHEKFHAGNLQNDYVILILANAVTLDQDVTLICLPKKEDQFDESKCVTSTLSKHYSGEKNREILYNFEISVIPHDDCQTKLRSTKLGRYFALHKSFICAGGELGKDTCRGDGGSPLVCPLRNDPSRYVQVGMVAWGIGCNTPGIPGAYANIPPAREWIDTQLLNNNLTIQAFELQIEPPR